ncbi:phospholipase BipL [Pseudomonas mangrovi]|uniref:Alpha/beta hydrolase n=1 Tax=Pseudomonas mangrovi TaxID=2161748 RepID=A0A2T5P5M2_9PSED|nr:alpha/beta hydrolase [Pseudomonas mangrovi]PTU73042.1 alpha/beta hydrolase [Pseudomonas mangrovi]
MPTAFNPELLRAALGPIVDAPAPDSIAKAYQAYYGLDFQARHPGVQARLGRFQVGGYEVVAQAWWPREPVATLLLMHGYYDHMGLYRHVIDWALDMGFTVLSCDLPGHGLSSGPRASINEFAEYQTVFRALLGEAAALGLPQPWHLLGQSTGGAILLDYLLHEELEGIGRSILLAPLVRPRAWGWSKLSYQLARHFVGSIPRRFSDNSGDEDFIRFVHSQDPLQPRTLPTAWVGALSRWVPRIENAGRSAHSPLIIQGEADMTVDWRHNLRVLQDKFTDPELLLLPDARHHLANEREALRLRYFDFLRERLR